MRSILLGGEADFTGWRDHARSLILADVPPEDVSFVTQDGAPGLFEEASHHAQPQGETEFRVPRRFVELAEQAALHRDADRFDLLYRILWRLRREPELLELASDPDIARLHAMAKAVGRDIHKMHAFVRFRAVVTAEGEQFVAWYEPDHHIVEAATPFFARRFTNLVWTILTPERSAHWNGAELLFGPGATRAEAPKEDELEALWLSYYASIFNPARPKPQAMRAEMPTRFWHNLPEARLIAPLLAGAEERTQEMIARAPTKPAVRRGAKHPDPAAAEQRAEAADDLLQLKREALECRACPLWAPATQTVFGEGPKNAPILLIGEQPGDQEDLAGRPFVGPAGKILDRALADAGLDRARAYVTNAVKHFKFEPRGKRRLHKKPSVGEIRACAPWLEGELTLVAPKIVVMLGASAAQAMLGRSASVMKQRGRVFDLPGGRHGLVTVHPSYLLRLQGDDERHEAYQDFVKDLKLAVRFQAKQA
ncbi:MAG: UdgX family uracil-DNA binding protein [Methylobacteriaceae bacterium]|nr:UdgX family uracil-DNA binding protein [Methylobacteriaceae bacterium]MBV9394359.1 UdgX family uracil-DNA binding protein [Methylobacteriaceae bacterium]